MKNEQMKKTMNGALILTISALIAKFLSAVYRIPFQNIVGNTGFYVYQQIYPIYGIGMTFALNGFPVFISKLVAQEDDEEKRMQVVSTAFLILLSLAVLLFFGLQVGAKQIARSMGDSQLAPLISSVSWMFLLMPFLAIARGYYQGTFNMIPTAVSQVSEQFVRVALIIGVALLSLQMKWSVYQTGSFAMLGSVAGGAIGVLTFTSFWKYFFQKHDFTAGRINYRAVARLIFKDGLIICLFSSLMVLLQLVDSFTVMNSLRDFGLQDSLAKYTKGIYDRGQPLVQLGMTIAISFSSTLLPSLTTALASKKVQEYQRIAKTMLHVGVALSVAAAAGMIILMPQINTLLFGDSKLSFTLEIYVLSVPLISVISIYNSILQSEDNFWGTFVAVIAALFIKVILNSWFVRHYGISGASLCTLLSLGAALLVLVLILPQSVRQQPRSLAQFAMRLAGCTLLMIAGIWLLNFTCSMFFETTRLSLLVIVPADVLLGVFLFVAGAIKSQLFTKEEWATLPGGSKIVAKLKVR